MQYDTVTITLRDVQPEKYQTLIDWLISMGLYGKASVQVKEAKS